MFCDERINFECGKIYRRGIIYATIIALFYGVFHGLNLYADGHFRLSYVFCELTIVISGIVILALDLVSFGGSGDERLIAKRHDYYLKAGKMFLMLGLAGYAVSIPLANKKTFADVPVNHLVFILEAVGVIYLFYSFKSRRINFNYSVIEEDSKTYYTHILVNIGKLAGVLFVAFGFAAMLDLGLNRSYLNFVSIMIAYAISVVGLGLEYLFISIVERVSNNDEQSLLTKAARIVCIPLLVVYLLITVLDIKYATIVRGNLSEHINVGEKLSRVSVAKLYAGYLAAVLLAMVLCYVLEQTLPARKIKKAIGAMLIFDIVSINWQMISQFAAKTFVDESLMVEYVKFINAAAYAFLAVKILILYLFAYGLIKDIGMSRWIWLLPVGHTVIELSVIIMSTQSALVLALLIIKSIAIYGLVIFELMMLGIHGDKNLPQE